MNYNDGKWHGWNGGECPVHPRTVVHFCCMNIAGGKTEASDLVWNNEDDAVEDGVDPVVAFRVIKEHREPLEFWVNPTTGNVVCSLPIYHENYIKVREVLE